MHGVVIFALKRVSYVLEHVVGLVAHTYYYYTCWKQIEIETEDGAYNQSRCIILEKLSTNRNADQSCMGKRDFD